MKRFAVVCITVLISLILITCSGVDPEQVTYTIAYDGNGFEGGSLPIDSSSYEVGSPITIKAAGTMTRSGYSFNGWNTASDGSGTNYAAGSIYTMGTGNMTLYAQWGYTVTYNGNGHTGGVVPTDSSGYTNGQEVIVVGNTGSLVKLQDGISLNFLGWTNSGGTFYTNNDIFSIGSASVTLYAKWSISVLRLIGPAGGFICYDKGSYSDGWRYLEVAAASTEWTKQWGSYGSIIGGTYTAIGTGQANTTVVVTWLNAHGETDRAAQLCDDLVYSGYSDWFLPSKDELNKMYVNLKSGTDENSVVYALVGGFANDVYWSSSEGTSNGWDALVQSFNNGDQHSNYEHDLNRVRAVRAF